MDTAVLLPATGVVADVHERHRAAAGGAVLRHFVGLFGFHGLPLVFALHTAQAVIVVEHPDTLAKAAPHERHGILLEPATKGGYIENERTDHK